eukprot:g6546.t1
MELLEAIQMYWRNSGCMENTVPDPLSEEDVNGMINSFAKHVSPCSKRCQGCGLEWLNTENMSFHRTKVFIEKVKNSNQYIFNPALEHIKYDSKVPSKSFADQPDMLQFTRQIPHMDQLYLKYTMRTKLYRARLTVKPARIPKEPIVPLFERTGVCPSNKFAVTIYIGTLQPRTGECIDKHQYDYALYREKLTFLSIRDMTNVAQTNALVPGIFNIQSSMLPHSLPTILEYDVDSHAAIDHLIKRSTIMMHDIITGAYLRSFKLL